MACDLSIERELRASGVGRIAGVDEAGRGPLAGPVVAAAVILPKDFAHPALDDSKKLTPKKREAIYEELTGDGEIAWSTGRAEVQEIEELNILRATHLAMERAVAGLEGAPAMVLIDGLEVKGFPHPQRAVVGGDGISLSIAAASVIAKVGRDRLMLAYDRQYPEYGFQSHKGYGTRKHLEELRRHGPCPIHRKTFGPVAQLSFEFGGADARWGDPGPGAP